MTKIGVEQKQMIDAARLMVPTLLKRARRAESDRVIPIETIDELSEQGFFRIHQPECFGGRAWDISMMVRLGSELGQGCGSSSWVFTNFATQNWILGMNYPEVQKEVWGNNPAALIASSFPMKDAKVERTDGGVIADGFWSFGSGIVFADWNNLQVFVPPKPGAQEAEHHFALVPRADYTIGSENDSSGLAGIGSRMIHLDNVFIPEYRTIPSSKLMGGSSPGSEINPSPLYRLAPLTMGANVFSSPALGIAKGGLAMIEENLRGRNTVGNAPMAELPTAQVRISEAGAEIDAAEALLLKDCAEAMAIAETSSLPEISECSTWRRNNSFAVQLCVRAMERLNPLVGARGLKPENEFLRRFQDVHAVSLRSEVAWDIQALDAGRIKLGLPALEPRR